MGWSIQPLERDSFLVFLSQILVPLPPFERSVFIRGNFSMDRSVLSISIEVLKTYELKRRLRWFKHWSIEPGVMKRDWV